MLEHEIERLVSAVEIAGHLPDGWRQKIEQFFETALLDERSWILKEIGKYAIWIFHAVIITALVAGCGYKADPYYQKREVRN